MTTPDPREIVAHGYDVAAEAFAAWLVSDVVDLARPKYLARFMELLPEGGRVLELGCGGGGPTTEALAARFELTGVDISETQIARSRERVPHATFVRADMTQFETAPASFDGVVAVYSLIHLPYGELPSMLQRLAEWLRPGGCLVANLSGRDQDGEHLEAAWLAGAPMYWSAYTLADHAQFLREAGLEVVEAAVEAAFESGEEMASQWLIARKAGGIQ